MRTPTAVVVAMAAMAASGVTRGADQAPARQGPLAGLPSRPGPHIEKIKALNDNSWLELGAAAADPKWGRARGRSWTSQMPLAAELRGAFLYGEGQHGYTKPNGHYMDDLWFYDVNAHRWICCYPGTPTKRALRLRLNADGFEATEDGDLVPVAQQVHGYEMNAYDTDAKRLLIMPSPHPYWQRAMPQRTGWLKPPPADASPWFYETTTGKWNRLRTGTPGPRSGCGDTLIYLPGRKQAFFLYRNQDVWIYDTQANTWQNVEPGGPKPPFGIDATSCYDSRRHRIYIGGGSYPVAPPDGHAFWIYDLTTHTWIDPKPKGSPCQGSNSYPTKNAVMVYDPSSDRVLLVFHSFHDDKPERLGVYVYDPNTNAWADEAVAVPEKLGHNRQAKNGFYDPELNVIFLHSAGDSRDDGTIWVYRYGPHRAAGCMAIEAAEGASISAGKGELLELLTVCFSEPKTRLPGGQFVGSCGRATVWVDRQSGVLASADRLSRAIAGGPFGGGVVLRRTCGGRVVSRFGRGESNNSGRGPGAGDRGQGDRGRSRLSKSEGARASRCRIAREPHPWHREAWPRRNTIQMYTNSGRGSRGKVGPVDCQTEADLRAQAGVTWDDRMMRMGYGAV